MEDRSIPDSAMTASSKYRASSSAYLARLNNQKNGVLGTENYTTSSWCAKHFLADAREYLQVDLGRVFYVTKVATQGRRHSTLNNWVMSYSLKYSLDGTTWNDYLDFGQGSKVTLVY
jgi:hypothetical protein